LFAPGEEEAILETLHEEYGDDLTAEQIEQAVAENVESKRAPEPRPEWQPTKPDLGEGVSHPARYNTELIDNFRHLLWAFLVEGGLNDDIRVLDPFAGTGRIHELMYDDDEGNPSPFVTTGIEIEPEWAALHPNTLIGNALDLPFNRGAFNAIVTSPTYGNRLADSHNATDPERRRSYTHDLGRSLTSNNSGTLHWRNGGTGSEVYRAFHEKAWNEADRVLCPGGLFILNCCDHIRDGRVQPVTAWHCWMLGRLRLDYLTSSSVPTRKLRQGVNGELREQEQVHVFRKPA
jgi:SAM-dependent methyltransferase